MRITDVYKDNILITHLFCYTIFIDVRNANIKMRLTNVSTFFTFTSSL